MCEHSPDIFSILAHVFFCIIYSSKTKRNSFLFQTHMSVTKTQCDTDQDGFISVRELDAFIRNNADGNFVIPRHKVREIEQMADRNGDGRLDQQEFAALMDHEEFRRLFNRHMQRYINFVVPPSARGRRPPAQLESRAYYVDDEDEQYMFEQFSCCPPPIFLFLITLIEFGCFIADELTEEGSTNTGSGVTSKIFIYDPKKKEEFWRYLTYILVHLSYGHLIMNLIVQVVLGVPLEMVHKWWRILIIYFTGSIAGCMAHSIFEPHTLLGGASGGVYALMTAHIADVIMNWGQMCYPAIQLIFYVILASVDLAPSIYSRYIQGIPSSVGVAAHGGGALAGLLVGIYTLRNLRVTQTEKYIWWAALALYVILMVIAIVINISCLN